ncbi:MAG: hypothetical protein ABI831_03145 [Betaproteobacteria bacterium]
MNPEEGACASVQIYQISVELSEPSHCVRERTDPFADPGMAVRGFRMNPPRWYCHVFPILIALHAVPRTHRLP